MAEGKQITSSDLDLEDSSPPTASLNLKEARETIERELVQKALRRHQGRIAPAATDLGISRPTLYELMDKLCITRPGHEDKSPKAD